MHSSRDKNPDPFYKPPTSTQKTSAEIINEARLALRILKTQRPFTPREDQRKLFGPTSSRTTESRPPSSFSLHSSSFECSDSRPVSSTRLSPLPHKPKLPLPSTINDDSTVSTPTPPSHPTLVRRTNITRARLFRAVSHGSLMSDTEIHTEEGRNLQASGDTSLPLKAESGHFATSLPLNNKHLQTHNAESKPQTQGTDPGMPHTPSNKNGRVSSGGRSTSSPCASNTEPALLGNKTVAEAEATLYDVETEDEILYWREKVSPLLQDLELAQQERNVDDLCHICAKLHKVLEGENMLGKRCKRRGQILKALYKLVEIGSDKLGLSLAKLILALKVSGKNLLNICKLTFKISRTENNDCLFQNDTIIDHLLSVLKNEDIQANGEAFLYCLGAIKFLSGNPVLLRDLLQKQAVEILVELMKQIIHFNKHPETSSSFDISHLLVQLTATLRNLADLSESRPKYLASNALPNFCVLLDHYISDKDICTNVSRLLSKLSSYNECCMALAECSSCYPSFLSVLNKHPKKQDLVVRILFTLGNLTAKNKKACEQFYKQKRSIKTLLGLLHSYCEHDISLQKAKANHRKDDPDNLKRPSDVEDVLIKLVRVLANLSIHPVVGTDLAANETCVSLLMKVLEYKSIDECEELVIDTVVAFNNLSYYQDVRSVITDRRLDISQLLLKLLLCNNMDAIVEVVRVFGNLSRHRDVRDFIMEKSVYKFVVILLDAKDQDVCFSACGVLINLTADGNQRALLKEEGGIKKLLDCLRDFGGSDWQLASLVCKAFWNFSENLTDAELCFGKEQAIMLLELLSSFLDGQFAMDYISNGDLMEYHRTCWEMHFRPVAMQLLSRIQSHYSYLEPLPGPV
ncbi:armadillo repeat-containing protein 2 [Spea bombifrons]|uniref:armadillo repeat-containing protein 2 n=1 Tax=Spea bombifrons TaxID=233779 RepID=UPI0023490EAE|nr:armadillo repeat-containing protein 2 [Spea bombifrons]